MYVSHDVHCVAESADEDEFPTKDAMVRLVETLTESIEQNNSSDVNG